jgi:septal ring factor EnvC (AmiA/AmiB activator)
MDMESKIYDLSKRISDGEVKISTTQTQVNTIFVAIKELKDAVIHVGASIDSIKDSINSMTNLSVKLDDVKTLTARVDVLEKSKVWVLGATASIACLATLALSILRIVG